jgi:1-acyl-sn-glycerol-3-phosphate acyltransferase
MSLSRLLSQRRFGPFFWTQFFGAFNDNFFKNALVLLVGYTATTKAEGDWLVNLSQGLLVLPFFLFSATAGQIADKLEKSRLIRAIKVSEIVIMMVAAYGFYVGHVNLLLVTLFLMGTQSSLFGPVKYSILPQHLEEDELVAGNGLIEMGTFVAILVGTIVSGLVMQNPNYRMVVVSAGLLLLALLGWLSSRRIPEAAAADPQLRISFNPIVETWRTIGYAREERSVWLSVLGISWLWFYGAIFLAQTLGYARYVLGGNQAVVTLLLAAFSVGVAAGSLGCEKLSGDKVEIGLVPLGAFGMSLFAVDLFFASPTALAPGTHTVASLLHTSFGWRVVLDLVLMGVFGGLFSVPLYALVQQRSAPEKRSRIIAANNVVNAGFMVAAAAVAIVALRWLSIPELFLMTAVMNAVVAIYIFSLVPEFMLRFLVWMLMHSMYRLSIKDVDRIPDDGAALLVCNHVTYVDALIISAACRRPIRFVMYYKFFKIPILSFMFRTAKVIPIAGKSEDEEIFNAAFDAVAKALEEGDLVCVFPEGQLTLDGEMNAFRRGSQHILKRTPVPVVPMALRGLWGSFFSRTGRRGLGRMRGLWSRIELVCSEPVEPAHANMEALSDAVLKLRGDRR